MATSVPAATVRWAVPSLGYLLKGNRAAVAGWTVLALTVAAALTAPLLGPHDPTAVDLARRLQPPSAAHPLGTDEVGQDLLSRILWGSRISLAVGVAAVGLSLTLGSLLGIVAAYFGGRLDALISAAIEVLLSFPLLLLSLVLVALLGQSLVNIVIAVGISGTPQFGRLVRACVLALREQDFVAAAKAVGATHGRVLRRHVLPNVVGPIVLVATLRTATAIVVEACLSFLGLGDPTVVTRGQIVAGGRKYLLEAPWVPTFGGLAITVAVLALNLIGDGLRDALDPRLSRAIQRPH